MGNAESNTFPYSLGNEITSYARYNTRWRMYEGADKTTGAPVTIFKFPINPSAVSGATPAGVKTASEISIQAARNAVNKLKIVRHPLILKYIAHEEIQGELHLVTEPVKPLEIPFSLAQIDPAGDDGEPAASVGDGSVAAHGSESKQSQKPGLTGKDAALSQMLAPNEQEALHLLMSLGIYQVTTALAFLHDKANMCHGKVSPASIFISPSGDWKLGCLELSFKADMNATVNASSVSLVSGVMVGNVPEDIRSAFAAEDSDLAPNTSYRRKDSFGSDIPESWSFASPEWSKHRWAEVASSPIWSHDMWGLGCLIYHLYGSTLTSEKFRYKSNPTIQDLVAGSSFLPSTLQRDFPALLAQNPSQRLPASQFLKSMYFANHLIRTIDFLDSLALKTEEEKSAFFKDFDVTTLSLPRVVSRLRIVPSVLSALEHGLAAGSPLVIVLPSLLKLATATLSSARFQSTVVPTLVKLFRSDERAVRVYLLQNAHLYAAHLPVSVLLSDILPCVLVGLRDLHPLVREVTVRALPPLCSKLPSSQIEARTLDALAALQADPQPEVRAHVTYSLAKLSNHYSREARERVLLQVFGRGLRDGFAPARLAAIRALSHCLADYSAEMLARRILPHVIGYTVDPVQEIRVAALKFVSATIPILNKYNQEMQSRPQQQIGGQTQYMTAAAAAAATGMANASAVNNSSNATVDSDQTADTVASKATATAGAVLGVVSSWAMSAVNTALNKAMIAGTGTPAAGTQTQPSTAHSQSQSTAKPQGAAAISASARPQPQSARPQSSASSVQPMPAKQQNQGLSFIEDSKSSSPTGSSSFDFDFDRFASNQTSGNRAGEFSIAPIPSTSNKPATQAHAAAESSWDSWSPEDTDELDLSGSSQQPTAAASKAASPPEVAQVMSSINWDLGGFGAGSELKTANAGGSSSIVSIKPISHSKPAQTQSNPVDNLFDSLLSGGGQSKAAGAASNSAQDIWSL